MNKDDFDKPNVEDIIDKVPDEAIIQPKRFGALKLVGYYIPPDCRTITEHKPLTVETYWTIEESLNKACRLEIKAAPLRECRVPAFKGEPHELLNSAYPVSSWTPHVIYRDKYELQPPAINRLANIDLQTVLKVTIDGQIVGEFKDPEPLKLCLPNFPQHKTEFDDIIYQSKPGICWTAEQLAAVTGGEWIVPPPKGWYVQSFPIRGSLLIQTPRPRLLVTDKIHSPEWRATFLEKIDMFAGAVVKEAVEDLPPDFPLLKVRNVSHVIWDIVNAARQRFKGKVISVTGSNGKTTTVTMLTNLLSQSNSVTSIIHWNVYHDIPWFFAAVNPNDAYAIIETAANALITKRCGSITYDITPNVAVVTSIAPAHLSKYGSLEDLAKGKSRILCGMTPGSYAVLNRDMPYYEIFEQKARALKLNIITFGTHPDSFIRMPVLTDGGEFTVMGKTYRLDCPISAEQLYDALAVIGVAIAIGLKIEVVLESLKTFETVKGRGNLLKSTRNGKNLTIIEHTFNANVESMRYALQYLKDKELNQKSRVAILGDIAELGSREVEYHKELVPAMLDAAPDRLLLCGKLMRHPYELVKDKLNVTWFATLEELLKAVDTHLRDGDTILVKSSHSTGLSKVVSLLNKSTPSPPLLNIPKPLFDIQNFLPDGITAEHNGQMPEDKLKPIHCGGKLYIDAARSWLAMVRAAAQDNVFLNLNHPSRAYRPLERQLTLFKQRFVPVDNSSNLSVNAFRVEFDGKIWQLKPKQAYAAIPGTSSHGYGLAVDIENIFLNYVKNWVAKNAEQFGFVREWSFEPWHFTYVKSREGIPARVLEIESLPPEPTYTAEEIEQASGGKWLVPPPAGWTCNGIFYTRPLRAGYIAVVNQGAGLGIDLNTISVIFNQIAALLCVNPESLRKFNRPLLVTTNLKDTIAKLDAFCASRAVR